MCFMVLVLHAHLPEFGAELVDHFLRRAGLARLRGGCFWLSYRRRLGIGHRSRKSWCKAANAKLIDFVGKIRQELIGGKTAARGWRWPGVLRDRLPLGRGYGRLAWPLVVRRDQRLRLQYQLILLLQLKFGLARLGRSLWSFSPRYPVSLCRR